MGRKNGSNGKRGIGSELAVFAAIGLFLGIIGPFGTDEAPALRKMLYWLSNLVVGGLIGLVVERLAGERLPNRWPRLLLLSAAMTPLVTLLVLVDARLFLQYSPSLQIYLDLLWQVFVIVLPVMAIRDLVWHRPQPTVERIVVPPLPEAEARFRMRLSARRRMARLIAVEAHDHYVRVHTDAGSELLGLRLADALDDLADAHGYRVHRSWWVAADAIETVQWHRGSGQIHLVGGVKAPISRSGAPVLRTAGWL